MTLNDKSSPEEIINLFGISKGQFKRLWGVDEGQNQARPVRNRVGSKRRLSKKNHFILVIDDGA